MSFDKICNFLKKSRSGQSRERVSSTNCETSFSMKWLISAINASVVVIERTANLQH